MSEFRSRYNDNRIKLHSLSGMISEKIALDRILIAVSAVTAFALLVASLGIIAKYNSTKNYFETAESARTTFYEAYGYERGIEALQAQNSEIKAWIQLDGTAIDAPVCQASDDKFYLTHDYLKRENSLGTLFFSQNDLISATRPDQNLVVYGRNSGSTTVFSTLDEFLDINFYNEHHIIHLYTKHHDTPFVVFAVMVLPSKGSGNEHFPDVTRSSFSTDRQFNDWFENINQYNLLSTDLVVSPHHNLLTLVTNCDDFEGARFVVMARQLELFEGSNIKTGKPSINSNAKSLKP